MNKKQIHQLIIEQQEHLIHELTQYLEELNGVADLDENSSLDIDDYSRQTESMDMVNRTNVQLEHAKSDLNKLRDYMEIKHESVVPGSLIETELNWFFVGVSTLPFKAEEKQVIGISVDSPVYTAMFSKQKGDSFSVGGHKYKILAVY